MPKSGGENFVKETFECGRRLAKNKVNETRFETKKKEKNIGIQEEVCQNKALYKIFSIIHEK